MIIECGYCGAPLDAKPNARTAKCSYCGTTSQTAQLRAVAGVTPPGWRPPKQWRPPEHVPADSAKLLTYRSPTPVWVFLLVPAIALIGVAGVVVAIISQQQSGMAAARQDMQAAMREAQRHIAEQTGAQPSLAAASPDTDPAARQRLPADFNLFSGDSAAKLVKQYEQHLGGPFKALKLSLYPTYAFLEAQDPNAPKNVDQYPFRNGAIEESEPVRLSFVRGKLEDNLFDPREVALEKLPELIRTTSSELAYEQAEVSHVIVERNLPFIKNVVIRVYMSGLRESGRIDFKADGTIQRVFK